MSHSTSDTPTDTPTSKRPSKGVAPRVFYPAAALVLIFVVITLTIPERFQELVNTANSAVVDGLGWYYVLIVTGFVFFCLWLAFSRLGETRLGKDNEEPEYGLMSWFAMLFAAGMGIGLVFYGVSEPLYHLVGPPPGVGGDAESIGQAAMTRTYLHWGVHAWAVYVIVGLSMAYAIHRRGRPVSIRWALEPILGKRTDTWIGDVIDVAAIVGTVFGVATSLGLGVSQIASGLETLGLFEANETLLVILIACITGFATISVVTGLDKGIKYLSNTNMILAVLLLLAVLILGPTLFILREYVQSMGSYLQNFLGLSFTTLPFYNQDGADWLGSWTTYYWGWWMAWSPFVGVFIARISRGRTVREFVVGVLLVPTVVTFLWFAVMGGAGMYEELFGGGTIVGEDGAVDQTQSLFNLMETLPASTLLSGVVVVLVTIFFVTSSDSGSFVVDMISHGGDANPPVWSRVFWAVLEGAIAAVVLGVVGADVGLSALQIMTILVAAPFSVVMIFMAIALAKGLQQEYRRTVRLERQLLQRELLTEIQDDLADANSSAGSTSDSAGSRRRRRGKDRE